MKRAYPAIFEHFIEDGEEGYTVEFPDLKGCVTEGFNQAEAIFMAEDAASGWILGELEEGDSIPKPSDISTIKIPADGFVSMIALDMDTYSEKYGKKAVKKTLTLPAWMNTYVETHGISCSKVLQDAVSNIIQSVG